MIFWLIFGSELATGSVGIAYAFRPVWRPVRQQGPAPITVTVVPEVPAGPAAEIQPAPVRLAIEQ